MRAYMCVCARLFAMDGFLRNVSTSVVTFVRGGERGDCLKGRKDVTRYTNKEKDSYGKCPEGLHERSERTSVAIVPCTPASFPTTISSRSL